MRCGAPLTLLLLAAPAAAAPSRLDTLLARGEALTRAANTECATPLEAAAFSVDKDDPQYPRAMAALGLCRELEGRYAEAHTYVSRALESAPPETTPAGKKTPWPTLRTALRRLDERVARVLVTWDEGAELYVDNKAAGGVSGRVMALDPGRHLFEARKAGKVVMSQSIEARAGDLPAVHLRAPKPPPPVAPRPALTLAPVVQVTQSPFVPTLSPRGLSVGTAYAAGAVALVAGVVAGVLEAQRMSLRSGLAADACPTPDASARCAQLRTVFEQSRAARDVALVAGGVAVVAGGVAIGLHLSADKVAPRTAGVTVGGSW